MKRSASGGTLLDKSNASGFTNYKVYLDASNRVVFSYDIPYSASADVTDITAGTGFTAGTHANTTYNATGQHVQLVAPNPTGTYTSAIRDAGSSAGGGSERALAGRETLRSAQSILKKECTVLSRYFLAR